LNWYENVIPINELAVIALIYNPKNQIIMKSEYTANGSVNEIEFDEKNPKDIIEKTSNLRQNFLSKYLSSDNLNFLISNGCSTCANS
jgi:hypothetical protein